MRNLHRRFVLRSNGQITVEILQNFVVFSEYMNFTTHPKSCQYPLINYPDLKGEYDEELMEAEEGYPPGGYTDGGGVRERTLLCPIQEEDTESTASAGSSVTGIANNTNKRSTVINNNNSVNQPTTSDTQDTHEDIQEEVHDGHYFIKVRQI